MKKFVRFLALVIAIMMVVPFIASCGGQDQPSGESGNDSQTEPQSGSSDTEKDTEKDTEPQTEPDPQPEPVSSHFDLDTFHIGTYVMGPHTTANVDDMKKAGIDFIIDGGFSTELLDYINSKKMGVFMNGVIPGWWGDNGQNGGQLQYSSAHNLDNIRALAAGVMDHPAIWTLDIGDEPSALDLEYYGKIAAAVYEGSGGKYLPYLNLYPGYASNTINTEEAYSQLGVASFREYLETYARYVDLPYICFDHYCYGNNQGNKTFEIARFYSDLRDCSDVCHASGKHLWIVLQCNTNDTNENNTLQEYKLRFQAYLSMAYGADQISWACWSPGWYYNNVLKANGEKTAMYDRVKKVNKELHAVGKIFEKYSNVATNLIGFKEGSKAYDQIQDEEWNSYRRETPVDTIVEKVNTARFTDVVCQDGYSITVGQMVSKSGNGSEALMIADSTDANLSHGSFDISFGIVGEGKVMAYSGTNKTELTKGSDGLYHVTMNSFEGILITVE